jgi:hypothetical protein
MLLAKPKLTNSLDSKQFETFAECQEYLELYTDTSMPLVDWIAIGKILVAETMTAPEFYPKKVKGQIVMTKFDIEKLINA